MSKNTELVNVIIQLDIELYNELNYLANKDDREISNYIKVLIKKHLGNKELTNKEKALICNTNLFKPRIILLMIRNNYSKDNAIEEVYIEAADRIREIFKFDHFNQFKDLFNNWKPVIVKDDLGRYKVQYDD